MHILPILGINGFFINLLEQAGFPYEHRHTSSLYLKLDHP